MAHKKNGQGTPVWLLPHWAGTLLASWFCHSISANAVCMQQRVCLFGCVHLTAYTAALLSGLTAVLLQAVGTAPAQLTTAAALP
jgi:hypothetical protein